MSYSKAADAHMLRLPTKGLVHLYKEEILGQLSDGMWENTMPHDHWKFWAKLQVEQSPRLNFEFTPTRSGVHPDRVRYRLTRLCDAQGELEEGLRATVLSGEFGIPAAEVEACIKGGPHASASLIQSGFKAYTKQELMLDLKDIQTFMAEIVESSFNLHPLVKPYNRPLSSPAHWMGFLSSSQLPKTPTPKQSPPTAGLQGVSLGI